MPIDLRRVTYKADYQQAASQNLSQEQLTLLQDKGSQSITRHIARIAEQHLGIKDYTDFRFKARRDLFEFTYQDAGRNEHTVTLIKNKENRWTHQKPVASAADASKPLPDISVDVMEIIDKVRQVAGQALDE